MQSPSQLNVYICLVTHESEHLSNVARDSCDKPGGIFYRRSVSIFYVVSSFYLPSQKNLLFLNNKARIALRQVYFIFKNATLLHHFHLLWIIK